MRPSACGSALSRRITEHPARAMRMGACDFVTKPFRLAAMRESVTRAVQRGQMARELRASGRSAERLRTELDGLLHQRQNPLQLLCQGNRCRTGA